jgi:hypothetical protein
MSLDDFVDVAFRNEGADGLSKLNSAVEVLATGRTTSLFVGGRRGFVGTKKVFGVSSSEACGEGNWNGAGADFSGTDVATAAVLESSPAGGAMSCVGSAFCSTTEYGESRKDRNPQRLNEPLLLLSPTPSTFGDTPSTFSLGTSGAPEETNNLARK